MPQHFSLIAIELAFTRSAPDYLKSDELLFIRKGNAIYKIATSDIDYIEVAGKYSKVISGGEKYLVQLPLKDFIASLPRDLFARVHRNYIINIKKILKIDTVNYQVFLSGGPALIISRRYLDELFRRYKILK